MKNPLLQSDSEDCGGIVFFKRNSRGSSAVQSLIPSPKSHKKPSPVKTVRERDWSINKMEAEAAALAEFVAKKETTPERKSKSPLLKA